MNLVVGATGLLGRGVCRALRQRGLPVRALVRASAAPASLEELRGAGVELIQGDLRDPASLSKACAGVQTVVSTASAMVSRVPGDSLATVDRDGQLSLIDRAIDSGVRGHIFVSVPIQPFDYPLQAAKQSVEQRLRAAPLRSTIVRPDFFSEVWLGPALWPMHGIHLGERAARFAGTGDARIRWISYLDVASLIADLVETPAPDHAVVTLAGPRALSPNEVLASLEKKLSHPIARHLIPTTALVQKLGSSIDPIEQSMTGLLLAEAHGDPIGFASSADDTRYGASDVDVYLDWLINAKGDTRA